ncbi:MAG: response regulator [Acidobacteria bacterium]|nr:response regulator [Acidobacteriota bacterium]
MPLILIAEDEPKIAQLLMDYLHSHGFETVWVEDGAKVVAIFEEKNPDAVLLDLMLPNRDGLEICRDLRNRSETPILMLTARADEIDRVTGLEIGADDYICKPFSPREVVARVKSVLRRSQVALKTEVSTEVGLVWDEPTRSARIGQHVLDLTPNEFNLLGVLFQNPERVFSRNQLMDRLYNDGRIVTDRTIDSHIKNLRKKLEEHGLGEKIVAIYGVGYKWDPTK